MAPVDLTKLYKPVYSATARPTLLDVPPLSCLLVEGAGDPNVAPAFQSACEALYSLSYALKFHIKKNLDGTDYKVMPLEGLWWCEDMAHFSLERKENWLWMLFIVQPPPVTPDMLAEMAAQVAKKKSLTNLDQLRLETLAEGRAAQVMHLGPYADEKSTVAALHSFIAAEGLVPRGRHHEIYLSDPRRCAPEKMKTILRQPVQ